MSTFHEGEVALQESAGSRLRMAEVGPRVIRSYMPDQHRGFFEQLPFIVAGSVDNSGQPWASLLAGPPGFIASPAPDALRIGARPLPHDPLNASLREGAAIGLLGIEPHTRRRNRANGRVDSVREGGFGVHVEHSFGNCPKYIQPREALYQPRPAAAAAPERMTVLDEAAAALIAGADTFFIATAHPQAGQGASPAFGVDVSHRGGPPGFVQVEAVASTLTVPDYVGNFFFNTLGNLQVEPRCGLLFLDFGSGDALYVAARATIVTRANEVQRFAGAQRLLQLEVDSAMRVLGVVPLDWK
jgi:predicted pyridoxine 5'-phosphate oxidase superfamily flavin-nucleotide-binding protein